MIDIIELEIMDLKDLIIEDFKDIIPNIVNDYNITQGYNPIFYTWVEDGDILGYMGIVYTNDITFCSYTKRKSGKIRRSFYNKFMEIAMKSKEKGIPIVTDGTNFPHCANHVKPYKDTPLFEWLV